ncbi:hypothetical protein [Pseudomonas brassicacearum]|uniref:hypothetical protein n=1 Tax=Pseudomonas brassicacearum TaxID=930166 RepID=UPI003D65D388
MERYTELRKVKRTWWRELNHRINWILFGTIGAVLLAFIPVLGWFLAFGVMVIVLWKTFGFRETLTHGNCPACTKALHIDPKQDVIACPICGSCMHVHEDRLSLIDIN